MNQVMLALVCGVAFGVLAVLLMLPIPLPNKRVALAAAFASRFAIGFIVPLVTLPVPGVAKGALIGLLISLPDAIVTRAYAPILSIGIIGGAVIGWLAAI